MCILKIYSDHTSFRKFANETDIPILSIHEKGDIIRLSKKPETDYKISFKVSDKGWNDFKGQVDDAIKFLKNHFTEIESLRATHSIDNAYLDFPIFSRLNEEVVNQNDHLPKELISLAGKLELGIEIAIYAVDAFNGFED